MAAIVATFAAVALLLARCGDSGSNAAVPSAPTVPSWVRSVYPLDGANAAVDQAVELDYGPLQPQQEVTLWVDGVDVTDQARGVNRDTQQLPSDVSDFPSPGSIRYDPATLAAPLVQLGPGEHHAEARLVELPGVGQPVKVIDAYHWSFTFGE